MKKKTFYTEAAYLCGLGLIALGVALMEKADFGVSMVVAPAYVLYRYVNPLWPPFTFGMAEYCFQAVLLGIMALALRRFRPAWLFSFLTAVIYGFILDGCMALAAPLPAAAWWQRGLLYAGGMLLSAAGVAMMFRTYLSPEVYELFVKTVSGHFGIGISRFKTGYDCVSCVLAVALSFLCFGFGHFVGVRWGTAVCALINGWLIGRCSALYDRLWDFKDRFAGRAFFLGRD